MSNWTRLCLATFCGAAISHCHGTVRADNAPLMHAWAQASFAEPERIPASTRPSIVVGGQDFNTPHLCRF